MNRFSMKDLGTVQQYLGLHIQSDDTSFTFHVAPYTQEQAAQYLTDVHILVLTPADRSESSAKASPGPAPTSAEYQLMQTLPYGALVLQEMDITQATIPMYEDNSAAISLATGLTFSANSRHIVVRYARVRQAVANKLFNVHYVPTREQLAVGLTKILPGPNFLRHLHFLMGQSEDNVHQCRRDYIREYNKSLHGLRNAEVGFEAMLSPQNGGAKTDSTEEKPSEST
jgi:hypothetical protein